MTSHRFSKARLTEHLVKEVDKLAKQHKFDLGNGTSQLNPKDRMYDDDIARAVAYGKMRALEELKMSLDDNQL